MNLNPCQKSFYLRHFLVLLLFLIFGFSEVSAQMFSVQEDDPVRTRATPNNGFFIGIEPAQFEFKGDESADPNTGIYAFDNPLLRIKFETIGFEAFVGTGGRLTGMDDVSYFDAGVKVTRGLRIFTRPDFQVRLPVMLKSSINAVSSDQFLGGGAQFEQGTFEFGGGGEVSFRAANRIRFSGRVVPLYGFSFATGGTFGGQIFELETRSRLYIDRLFGEMGLSVGWDYGFKSFDVDGTEFDYDLRAHSLLIGLTF